MESTLGEDRGPGMHPNVVIVSTGFRYELRSICFCYIEWDGDNKSFNNSIIRLVLEVYSSA